MSATIEFIFDFGSPNAYLAYRAFPPILERTGARLAINPCLLGGIFKATGNQAPGVAFAGVKGKLDYETLEMRRFIARHAIDKFRLNPHFPVNTLMLMRGLVAAREAGEEAAYLEMGLQACGKRVSSSTIGRFWRAGSTRRGSIRRACSRRPRPIASSSSSPTTPRPRSRAACSGFRLFSWARRCSSARSGSGRSKRRSGTASAAS